MLRTKVSQGTAGGQGHGPLTPAADDAWLTLQSGFRYLQRQRILQNPDKQLSKK